MAKGQIIGMAPNEQPGEAVLQKAKRNLAYCTIKSPVKGVIIDRWVNIGQTDFLSVLDAQRSLFTSEDSLVQSTRDLSTDLIAIYKALGGGWDSNESAQPAE